jgi:hypothetical protein
VVAVAVALVSLEPCNQHERAVAANDAHDVAQHRLAPPFLECLVEALGEAVVDDRCEVLPIQAVVAAGQQQLLGSNQSDRVEQLGSDRVVARLAAVQRQQRHARSLATAQLRQHAAVLVVWMRRRVHDAGGRLQLEESLPRPNDAAVLRQRLGCRMKYGDERQRRHRRRY